MHNKMELIFQKIWNLVEKVFEKIVISVLHKFHIDLSMQQWKTFMQFVKFCMVGLSSAVVMYAAYYMAFMKSNNYFIANFFGFVLSVTNSFIWNNLFIFEKQKGVYNIIKAYGKSLLMYSITGLLISNILAYLWIDVVGISEFVSPIINIILVLPMNYFLNKYWAFK